MSDAERVAAALPTTGLPPTCDGCGLTLRIAEGRAG